MYSITNYQDQINDHGILKLGFFFNKTNAILARNIMLYYIRIFLNDFKTPDLNNAYVIEQELVEDALHTQSVNWIDGLDLSYLPLDYILPIEQTRSYADKLTRHMDGILNRANLL